MESVQERKRVQFSKVLAAEDMLLELLRAELNHRVGESWFQRELELYTPMSNTGAPPALWFDGTTLTVALNSTGWVECEFLAPDIRPGTTDNSFSKTSFILMTSVPQLIPRVAREIILLYLGYSKLFQQRLGASFVHSEIMFEDLSHFSRPGWRQKKME